MTDPAPITAADGVRAALAELDVRMAGLKRPRNQAERQALELGLNDAINILRLIVLPRLEAPDVVDARTFPAHATRSGGVQFVDPQPMTVTSGKATFDGDPATVGWPDPPVVTRSMEIPADHPMAAEVAAYVNAWLTRCGQCKHPRAAHDLDGCHEMLIAYVVAPSNRPHLTCDCRRFVEPEPDAADDADMPWTDHARDFGDAPIDDDTGQPSQPPARFSHWAARLTLTAVLDDGSPFHMVTTEATGMEPHKVVAAAWLDLPTLPEPPA